MMMEKQKLKRQMHFLKFEKVFKETTISIVVDFGPKISTISTSLVVQLAVPQLWQIFWVCNDPQGIHDPWVTPTIHSLRHSANCWTAFQSACVACTRSPFWGARSGVVQAKAEMSLCLLVTKMMNYSLILGNYKSLMVTDTFFIFRVSHVGGIWMVPVVSLQHRSHSLFRTSRCFSGVEFFLAECSLKAVLCFHSSQAARQNQRPTNCTNLHQTTPNWLWGHLG